MEELYSMFCKHQLVVCKAPEKVCEVLQDESAVSQYNRLRHYTVIKGNVHFVVDSDDDRTFDFPFLHTMKGDP